jgi:kynurenine formamidase
MHKILLGHGIILIENLTNLHLLPKTGLLLLLPDKNKNGDGSFIRAIGMI